MHFLRFPCDEIVFLREKYPKNQNMQLKFVNHMSIVISKLPMYTYMLESTTHCDCINLGVVAVRLMTQSWELVSHILEHGANLIIISNQLRSLQKDFREDKLSLYRG